jgi:hypothetical protein
VDIDTVREVVLKNTEAFPALTARILKGTIVMA